MVKRKITTSFLLVVFLLNGAGFFQVYQFMAHKRKNSPDIRQSRREELVHITITEGESTLKMQGFKQLDEGEYGYKGHCYDVVKQVNKKGKITISLKHDSFEEGLLIFLRSFFRSGASDRQDQTSLTFKRNIFKQYLPSGKNLFQRYLVCSHFMSPDIKIVPPRPFQEILVPPPQAA